MNTQSHLDRMKQRAAEIVKADPEALEWFRYGATYVVSLMAMVDFYNESGRCEEAEDALVELKHRMGATDSTETIVKNLLRLGIYWDEATQVDAAQQPGLTLEALLDIVRTPIK